MSMLIADVCRQTVRNVCSDASEQVHIMMEDCVLVALSAVFACPS